MGQEDMGVLHMEIGKRGFVLDTDWDNRVEYNNSRVELGQRRNMQQMDIEDSSGQEEQEQWVEELGERGTSILGSGVEREEFGIVREVVEEVEQSPVVGTVVAAVVVGAVAVAAVPVAVVVVVVAVVVAAAAAVEVVDTDIVGTSTSLKTGDVPMARIGDCCYKSLFRRNLRRLFPLGPEYLGSRHCESETTQGLVPNSVVTDLNS